VGLFPNSYPSIPFAKIFIGYESLVVWVSFLRNSFQPGSSGTSGNQQIFMGLCKPGRPIAMKWAGWDYIPTSFVCFMQSWLDILCGQRRKFKMRHFLYKKNIYKYFLIIYIYIYIFSFLRYNVIILIVINLLEILFLYSINFFVILF